MYSFVLTIIVKNKHCRVYVFGMTGQNVSKFNFLSTFVDVCKMPMSMFAKLDCIMPLKKKQREKAENNCPVSNHRTNATQYRQDQQEESSICDVTYTVFRK